MANSKKKEKKKLKRLQQAGNAQNGNVLHFPQSSSNVGSMLASLQTVKKQHEVQTSPVAQPQMQSSRNLPEVDEDESWTDDEDANDGGSIPANVAEPVTQVSAPIPESTPPVIEAPSVAAPNSETDYNAAVNVALSFATQTENRNVETQPEAHQEKNMNVVNHPDQVAQAAPAPITTPDNGIVAEGAMERMQSDANFAPPAANVDAGNSNNAEQPKGKTQAAFHSIQLTSMFTLDLTNFNYMMGLKSSLSRVNVGGEELNLYSPFRRGGKKNETKPAAEGVLRYVLPHLLDLTDAVNNSRVMVVGNADDVQAHIQNSIDITKKNIVNLFPTRPAQVVASFIDEEADATIQLQFGDIVNVRSWTNSSAAHTDDENIPFEIHNAVINTTVNAGVVYDAEDRVKEIHRIIKAMELMVGKREESNTTIVMAIALDASLLADAAMREMLDTLLANEDFAIYSRQELLRLEENDFLPQTRESVENDLLVPKADIMLLRVITDEPEDEEAPEEGAAEDGGDAAAETDAE